MIAFRRIKNLCALLLGLAVFNSAGGHLFALQSIAWGGMLWSHAQHEAPLTAVINTFDGKHPCNRCHEIARGQAKSASIPAQELERRFDPFFVPAVALPRSASQVGELHWLPPVARFVTRESRPATPPPRFPA